mgnify:FL=1
MPHITLRTGRTRVNQEKYEFSSQAWVDCAHQILVEAAGDTDLSSIEVTFSEVFTDAPPHLDPDENGRIGWYMQIKDGELNVKKGIPDRADLRITTDYQLTVPLGRAVFEGNPEAAAEAGKVVAELTEKGIMVREGDEGALASLAFFEGFHDKIARRTA